MARAHVAPEGCGGCIGLAVYTPFCLAPRVRGFSRSHGEQVRNALRWVLVEREGLVETEVLLKKDCCRDALVDIWIVCQATILASIHAEIFGPRRDS